MLLIRDRNQPAQTCEEDLRRDPGDSFLLFCPRSTSAGGNSSAGSSLAPLRPGMGVTTVPEVNPIGFAPGVSRHRFET